MNEFKKIISKTNPIIKKLLNLDQNEFLICNLNLINEAIKSNYKIKQLFVLDAKINNLDQNIIKVAEQKYCINKQICEKLSSNKNFCYIFAVVQKQKNNQFNFNSNLKNIILLDNVQNPENIGLITRTMLGLGYDLVILYNCCSKYNIKAISSSSGICLNPKVVETKKLNFILNNFKNHLIISTALADNSQDILKISDEIKQQNKIVVFGNEGQGISNEILKISNKIVKLQMYNNINSFNISISCALIGFLLIK